MLEMLCLLFLHQTVDAEDDGKGTYQKIVDTEMQIWHYEYHCLFSGNQHRLALFKM
jgi:hypothetical protein